MDKDHIDKLIALGTDPASIVRVQDVAAREMQRNGLGYTLHSACAATLSSFLNEAGINVPVTLGAGRLARRLHADRGWMMIERGRQLAGDVGVTYDTGAPAGADHIYLVVARIDDDEMRIADNQKPLGKSHARFVSGRLAEGRAMTPTEYFLRAQNGQEFFQPERSLTINDVPDEDEDTNDLPEPFNDDGSPATA
jgi:hypothetical protein